MEKNKYDKDGSCIDRGLSAEDQFSKIVKNRGWEITKATKHQDINEHWDLKIEKEEKSLKVDVKGIKKMKRADSEVQDKWIWVELHGVRQYDNGWLYASKADLIAFEKKESFLIVKRSDLIELLPMIIDMDSFVTNVEEAKYRIYQRSGRPDKITLIELDKLDPIKWDEWEKNHIGNCC